MLKGWLLVKVGIRVCTNPNRLFSSVRRILKRGGYFERVRSVQTTLTRIFIDLESVSDGLSETWGEMSRKARKFKKKKSRVIFPPKIIGDLQKKKKKKKRSSPKFRVIFRPKSEIQRFFLPKMRWSPKKQKKSSLLKVRPVFHPNSLKFPAKSQKAWCPTYKGGGHASILLTLLCNFAILATQGGGHGPMAPPLNTPLRLFLLSRLLARFSPFSTFLPFSHVN